MLDSIRSKLLIWNAVVLTTLVVVFGAMLWFGLRRTMYRTVDQELATHAQALARGLRRDARGVFDLDISSFELEYFNQEKAGAPFYALWDQDGSTIDTSDPEMKIPNPRGSMSRDRGLMRELAVTGPVESIVLVGRDIAEEHQRLAELLAALLIMGGATLALTLAGGWFLTGRALAPIGRITRAAAEVSASKLHQSIEVGEMEWELRDLASTINAAFDRLREAIERQTNFTADASHELRTPLSIILSQAESALSRSRDAAEYREALEAIRRGGERMRSIVDGLLTLARAESGHLIARRDPVQLDQLIREAIAMLAPSAEQNGVQLHCVLAPVRIKGDRDRLTEAMVNVLNNAVRYNHPGGTVETTLTSEADRAVITVRDTGIGIPADDLTHIFDRFYRVDKARSRAVGGSGLGLPIAKSIIEGHSGSIEVRSDDSGSTFTIRLGQCT